MELAKILMIGIITSFISLILKNTKPEIAVIVGLSGTIIILIMIIDMVTNYLSSFSYVFSTTGLTTDILSPLFKIIGIGYLCEFSANICRDTGNASIADKLLLAGKIIILFVAMPIINSVIDTVMGLLI